jgi:hypothetical protein
LIAYQSEPGAVEVQDVPLYLGFTIYLTLGADRPHEHRTRESFLLPNGTTGALLETASTAVFKPPVP